MPWFHFALWLFCVLACVCLFFFVLLAVVWFSVWHVLFPRCSWKAGAVATQMARSGHQIWLFGSQKDLETCNNIRALVPTQFHENIHVLAGQTSLIEAVDLLAACKAVVANDSGLMHVAAAVGCNVVAVYGSTSPKYTPPLAEKVEIVHTDIDCRPCFQRECQYKHLKCLTELSPKQVLDSIQKLDAITISSC